MSHSTHGLGWPAQNMMPGIGIVHVSIYHIKSMLSSRVQHFGCFRSMFNETPSIITRASARERENTDKVLSYFLSYKTLFL